MKIEENILHRHLNSCVYQSFSDGDNNNKEKRVKEVIDVLKKFRKY